MPVQSGTSRVVREVTVAEDRFAPGHLGELTQIVPFEMVDAALDETDTVQQRVRDLPSRVVVYLLLAGALFVECGYRQVWARLVAGLDGLPVAEPSAAGLAAARRRIGPAPLGKLFELLRGPAAGPATKGVWWRGRLVTAIDGTTMCCPDTPANLTVHRKGGSHHGGTGYPMVRLLALVACGTRTIIDAVFGSIGRGETGYAADLVPAMRAPMIVLADRNFAAADLIDKIADRGADLLIRVKSGRRLPVCRRCADGSWLSRIGQVEVRVIRAQITIDTGQRRRSEAYQLVTTVTDADCPAVEIVGLYHQRWEIETAYCELKQSIGGGRVLRARTPAGLEQEIYARLIAYQALRIAITDATLTAGDIDPDRASFTVALRAARDQLVKAAGVIADTSVDLVGVIGDQVLASLLPARRRRNTPRVVKRAISTYAPHTASGRLRGPSHRITISIDVLADPDP
ncbi:IS4 family transposase [Blastococcus sp. PRF04-17]|uniref:IS4 family transposase n=1 Tax=Blastococcus sp. PRF04-17 TaxID=2933797 RepID=UPI001FF2B146|nr:IS4 family transposase [Blastococcus sp. PRF04-17]UOY03504.1 IS4 family transposase [Blastococcus sp. PRF04-17]